MPSDSIQTCADTSAKTAPSPYRRRPLVDPELRAQLDAALCAARSELKSARRTHLWSTRLAVSGYIAAALFTSSLGGNDASGHRAVIGPSMAAGATCALFRAGRAGSRTHDLEAELEELERLSTMLARTPS